MPRDLADLDAAVRDQTAEKAATDQLATARAAFVLGKAGKPETAGVYAFLASLSLKLKMERRDAVQTMATDGRHLWWALDYVQGLDAHQTISEVAHETFHCMLLHPARMLALLGPNPTPDRVKRAQLAADCAVDPIARDAGFWNPPTAIFPAQFQLPEGLTFEEYFRRLPDDAVQKAGGAGDHGQVLPAPGADGKPDPAAAQASEAEWRVAVEQARRAAKLRGTLPAALDSLCDAVLSDRVDWRMLLRDFFTVLARDDYSWMRPNRRHVADGLYLPSLHNERLGRVVVVLDTSGSMSNEAVSVGLGELRSILELRPTTADVLLHDSRLYAVHGIDIAAGDPWPAFKMRRGGTSHRPAFDWIREHAPDAAAVVCFTDCESDLDACAVPPCPVFFLKPPEHHGDAPAWAAGSLVLP